jgi:hypothetical protein
MASMLRSATERDVVVIEFPRPDQFPLGATREILSLAEAEIVRVDQVGVVHREPGGRLISLPEPFDDLDNPISAFRPLAHLSLSWDLVTRVCETLEPDRCAALFVLEHTWAIDLADELASAHCRTLTRVPVGVQLPDRS